MKNIVLIGFMGSGKTSAGKLVAKKLAMRFVDTDALIEERAGKPIHEIFAQDGESHFRSIERAVVASVAADQNLVIATGGGIVLNPDNLRDLSATGILISLWVEPSVAFERTKSNRLRPLLETDDRLARIESLLSQRAHLYRAIQPCIDTSTLSVAQQADEIIRHYRLRLAEHGAGG
jgi:shikimate kinase